MPGRRSLLLRCFFRPRALEDVFHGVVAFVAGVLKQWFVDTSQGHGGGPRSCESGRIVERIAVVDRPVVHAPEALCDVHILSRRSAAVEGSKPYFVPVVG